MAFLLRAAVIASAIASNLASAQFRVIPGKGNEDGCFPRSPARICLGDAGNDQCFAPASTKLYIFGLDPQAVQIGKIEGAPLVLFSATFSGCGSGTLTDYSILTIKKNNWVSLAPTIRLTDQSEYKLWNLPSISPYPVFATADFIWDFNALEKSGGSEETHFARHRYRISAYVFDPKRQRYVQRIGFDTKNKYKGLDEADEIRVLEAERAEVLSRLR